MKADYRKFLYKYLPEKFVKHYIIPATVRGKRVPAHAESFFDSWYGMTEEFTDGIAISPAYNPLYSNYYYNLIENSLTSVLVKRPNLQNSAVLDIGSGPGHWIDFFRDVCRARSVVGVDISGVCVERLREKYAGRENVEVLQGDVSLPSFDLNRQFDLIVSIATFFHITDDDRWRIALRNIRHHLRDGGLAMISGYFGRFTVNSQLYRTDAFSHWNENRITDSTSQDSVKPLQRIRSLHFWKRAAGAAGLEVKTVMRNRVPQGIFTPETNIIVLAHKAGRAARVK